MQKLFDLFTKEKNSLKFWVLLAVVYLLTHLFNVTSLPVFADESIYIRWAQLIMDEPARYFFFSLNDGKTPLFIWLLVPFQYVFSDQLFAARFVSVVIGLFQVLATVLITKKLGGTRISQQFAAVLVTISPFWYFHHRMGLMDGLLTVFLSFTLWSVLHVIELPQKRKFFWLALTALFLGAAFWTKLPAVLAIPPLFLLVFFQPETSWSKIVLKSMHVGVTIAGAIVIFALMRISPAFGQLFARGSDFLYPISDVLFKEVWQQTLPNLPTYLGYFTAYLSFGSFVLIALGMFLPNAHRRTIILLTLGGLLFIIPIAILGRVVYPRYLVPAALFFTVSTALALEHVFSRLATKKVRVDSLKLLVIMCCVSILLTSGKFMTAHLFDSDATPFTESDKVQYLTEWSSGHGIKETTELIQQRAELTTIAVATEGYFGTLPDGILLYLHGKPVDNLWVEGIGQPVTGIPDVFINRAKTYQESWLVVNSHRMKIVLPPEKLLHEFCRPYSGPCLQIWDITEYIQNPPPSN